MADTARNQELDCEQNQTYQIEGGPRQGQACSAQNQETGSRQKARFQTIAKKEGESRTGQKTVAEKAGQKSHPTQVGAKKASSCTQSRHEEVGGQGTSPKSQGSCGKTRAPPCQTRT